MPETVIAAEQPPRESYRRLFLRFLRFGLLAWGGPVAQIAMIRQELVDEERWVSNERFNRVLAVYQVLPGPEAHELCVYFGYLAGGRVGGFLAGLGFMLPGFVLMFALSWFYFTYGIGSALFQGVFFGFQAAVVALIVRAIHRIGAHALADRWLLAIAVAAALGSALGVHFAITLLVAGAAYVCVKRGWLAPALALEIAFLAGAALFFFSGAGAPVAAAASRSAAAPGTTSPLGLLLSGLRAGLLTFGGAYTAIPFLQNDAVVAGGWMSNQQFLDGIALSGILPAPLIIFSTFVGYAGGGALGALAITFGIFLPAFAFTLVGHEYLERLISTPGVHTFLDGVTAGVVGLIAVVALDIARATLTSWQAALIFGLALVAVYLWKAKAAVAGVVLGAGVLGLLLMYVA
ncbi:chromate transporter [Kouleothrix aurantiaca]|uniref:Chromate transporter n=1 Tax=Kouleothrix aurantiaca TaxID=186479 RepID=A0A0P9D2S4_9CHLR|nr:chromate transporter [Kouleothrix aurantiaca]